MHGWAAADGAGSAAVAVSVPGEAAADRMAAALRSSLDAVPVGIVACDANARLLYGNRTVRTMLGEFTEGLPAELWPSAYDLRGPEGDPVRDVEDIPLVAAMGTGEVQGRMHQRCCDGLVGLIAHVVSVVDEHGAPRGAVGVFEPVPPRIRAGANASGCDGRTGRAVDPAEQVRMMLAVAELLERRRQRAESDPLLRRLDSYLSGRLHESLDLRSVAVAMSLTPAYLTHRVATLTGRPVMRLVRERRMAAARRLLADTDLPVTSIAGRVSPWDPAYFARVFRDHHGCSPAGWRSRARSNETEAGRSEIAS
ncbi:MAG: helix-turn-helix domain-containing protein [bacterium]